MPIYFGQDTYANNIIYTFSDMAMALRPASRGNVTEKVYLHAYLDYCGFNEDGKYGFEIIGADGNTKRVTEFKGIFEIGPNGIITDNKFPAAFYLVKENDGGDIGGDIMPAAFEMSTEQSTQIQQASFYEFIPCTGLTIDIPEFRMQSVETPYDFYINAPSECKMTIGADGEIHATCTGTYAPEEAEITFDTKIIGEGTPGKIVHITSSNASSGNFRVEVSSSGGGTLVDTVIVIKAIYKNKTITQEIPLVF